MKSLRVTFAALTTFAAWTLLADWTGVGTTNVQTITNKTIYDSTIGLAGPAAGNFTTVTMTGLTLTDSATNGVLTLTARAAAPSAPVTGEIYLDDGTNTATAAPGFRRWTGAAWADIGAATASGAILANGTVPLAAAWDAGSYEIRALTFQSDQTTGTAPFTVASTTVVTNLNADTVDGESAGAFQDADAGLTDIAALAVTDGNVIVGDGANWVAESGATARASLGLTIDTHVQAYDAGLADIAGLAVADGNIIVGDGANWVAESGATARTSLGLAIGTDVQAFHAYLADLAGITANQGDIIYFNGTDWVDLGPGTNGYFLKTQGAAANPVWANIPGGGDMLAATYDTDADSAVDTVSAHNGATSAGYITIREDTDDGINYLTLTIPALASDYTLVFPANTGGVGQVLTTNGSGVTSWTTPAGAGDMLAATWDGDSDGFIDADAGGTDQDSSAWTGVATLSGGTWSVQAQLTHELGGLESDVSAYSGLLKITGGATSAVTIGDLSGNVTVRPTDNDWKADALDEVTVAAGVTVDSLHIKDGALHQETLLVGENADNNITIEADNGDANNPALRYTAASNKWQYSNDGTTFADVGSGSGAGGGAWGTVSELTLSSGAVTPTGTTHIHTIDTEGDAATDELDTLTATNMDAGDMLLLMLESTSPMHAVWITTNGNIDTPDGRHYPIPPNTGAMLEYDGTNWRLLTCGQWSVAYDTTQAFTSGQTAAAMNALIDQYPRYIPAGVTLTFQFGDGTYNTTMTSALEFAGFYGGGALVIQGNTGEADATALHTSQSVYLDFSAGTSDGIYVHGCTVEKVSVYNLKVEVADAAVENAPIHVANTSSELWIYYNYVFSDAKTNNKNYGIWIRGGMAAWVQKNYVSNMHIGIIAEQICPVFSDTNDDTGTAPNYGLFASQGAAIGKNSTQPAGTVATEGSAAGGVIR